VRPKSSNLNFKIVAKVDEKDSLRNFMLSFGRVLNVSRLERELKIGNRTMRDWLAGTRSFNPKSRVRLEVWARNYGWHKDWR